MMRTDSLEERSFLFETAWGWAAARTAPGGVLQFELPASSLTRALRNVRERFFGGAKPPRGFARFQFGLDTKPREIAEALGDKAAGNLADQVRAYYDGKRRDFTLPLLFPRATPFRKKVWKELARIPFGKTATYGDLAARTGQPGAARAVGGAAGANPIPLIVPCHRVVAAGGRLGGFSADGGVAVKKQLLEFEKSLSPAE